MSVKHGLTVFLQQSFPQFFKLTDIYLKAPDAKCFGAARCLPSADGASYLVGVWGAYSPLEIFKIEHTETPKTQFPTQGWSSLKFSIKRKFFNGIGQLDREQGDREGGLAVKSWVA